MEGELGLVGTTEGATEVEEEVEIVVGIAVGMVVGTVVDRTPVGVDTSPPVETETKTPPLLPVGPVGWPEGPVAPVVG